MNLADLKRPFPPEAVKWRVGSTNKDKSRGMALAYIDARDVMDRLDEVCGPENWESRFEAVGGRIVCAISIWCRCSAGMSESAWVRAQITKSDGAGDTDFEPEKGGLSDAFKRAAVQWGIGRYLYDIPAPWVAIEPAGKSFRIKESERPTLDALLRGRGAPQDARGAGGSYHPTSDTPAPAGAAPDPNDGMAKLERWRRKADELDDIGDIATMDAWLYKNGAKHFGELAGEAGAILQARLEELRAAK